MSRELGFDGDGILRALGLPLPIAQRAVLRTHGGEGKIKIYECALRSVVDLSDSKRTRRKVRLCQP